MTFKSTIASTLAGLFAGIMLVSVATSTARAEDRVPNLQYVEEKGHSIFEQKRVTVTDKNGKLVAKVVHFTDGRVSREEYRPDGTLNFTHEVYGNGKVREHIEYDATGKTVSKRQTYRLDGSLDWEASRNAAGNTLRKDYYPDGKLRKERELFDKNGFADYTYRKDGTKWYGSERKPGETGRGASLYYAADGKSLKRLFSASTMTVTVSDKTGTELYTQTWTSGVARYQLVSIKEPTTGGGWRVVNINKGQISSVDYYKSDGKLDRTEQPGSLSTPVDASRLQELNQSDDPTIPTLHILR